MDAVPAGIAMKHETIDLLLRFRAEHGDFGAKLALKYGKTQEGAVELCYCGTDEEAIEKAKEWNWRKGKAADA